MSAKRTLTPPLHRTVAGPGYRLGMDRLAQIRRLFDVPAIGKFQWRQPVLVVTSKDSG